MQSGPAIHPDSTGELRRYEALLEMADLMVRHGSLPELFHEMAGRLRKVADFQFLNFSVHDPLSNRMHPHWWEGESTADLPMELPVSESASGWAWEEELRFRDFHGETRFPRVLDVLRTKGTRTYYMMPLTTTQKRLGALGVARSEADAYREDRRLLRRVAELVALAVPREPLLDLLQRHGEAGLRSAQALSREFQSA